MSPEERLRLIRAAELARKHPSFAECIGVRVEHEKKERTNKQ